MFGAKSSHGYQDLLEGIKIKTVSYGKRKNKITYKWKIQRN